MGNGCTSGCCKKAVPMQINAIAQTNLEIKAKDTPNGYCKLYPGSTIYVYNIKTEK